MATMSKADSRRMYSWWWNSHISPKNSKWLQENLTDMDAKVKAMIKLIEEDADSFARRAEMYYKKRPELMKLVEEFYRAYRALAERYDHATGALRQAHRTMAEAFPNQIPLLPDDSPYSPVSESEPRTPEASTPLDEESDSIISQKGLRQLNGLFGSGGNSNLLEGRARKGLNFNALEEIEGSVHHNGAQRCHAGMLSESEKEIEILKEALAKLEAEKEAGLIQYQQSLESLSKLELEVSHAQQDSRELTERASRAEAEAQALKERLNRVEAEKEDSLLHYQQSLARMSTLGNDLARAREDNSELADRARNIETKAHILKQDLVKLESEKDAALDHYNQSLETMSALEKKLQHVEEEARKLSECAEKADVEVENLKQAIAGLTEEKEAQAILYLQCLDTISSLEHRLSLAQEEAERLNGEIANGEARLRGAEEECLMLERSNQSLRLEFESTMLKMGTHSQELTEKQKELGRLWTCIQEERLRFVEAETAFQTLQHLHAQAQEELRSLASELQNRARDLRDIKNCNQYLQEEILKLKEENKDLSELNLSSATAMEDMHGEIFSLKETKEKLEEQVELRVNERNALQQEIYCLKEERKELNKNYETILEQVDSVGLNPECFGSSVKELQGEHSILKEDIQKERNERLALLEKLVIMEQLLEKNAFLENSLSDLSTELEAVRERIKALEESCESLLQEKSTLADEKDTLLDQLQATSENLGKLSEKNTVLENSLSDVLVELEVLKAKSKSLEDSCQLLLNERSVLISEKGGLVLQMEITQKSMQDLEMWFAELEEKYLALEKEKDSALRKAEEERLYLAVQEQKHVRVTRQSETQMAVMASQICLLQEESQNRKKEYEEEADKVLESQIELFVLLNGMQDLREKSNPLLFDYQKLFEESRMSEELISKLENDNTEKRVELKSLSDHVNVLRIWMHKLLKAFNIVLDCGHEDEVRHDQTYLDRLLNKVEDREHALAKTQDENSVLDLERVILITIIDQLETEVANRRMEKKALLQELSTKDEKLRELQSEAQKLLDINEELRSKSSEGDRKEELLTSEIQNLRAVLLDVQNGFRNLEMENSAVLEGKRYIAKKLLQEEEKSRTLEEENLIILDEVLRQTILSLVLKKCLDEKFLEINGLCEDQHKLVGINEAVKEKLLTVDRQLEELQTENLHLNETLQKSEREMVAITIVRDQLNTEIMDGKNLLIQKETELLEARQQLKLTEKERSDLCKITDDLKRKHNELNLAMEEKAKHVVELSEASDCMGKEHTHLKEASHLLELKLLQSLEDLAKTKNREEKLCLELLKETKEIEELESEAAAIFGELQTSVFCQALFGEKVHELDEACASLLEERISKDASIELQKQRANSLEGENEGLRAQLAAYGTALVSLKGCVSSLEIRTSLHTRSRESDNEEPKVAEVVNHQQNDSRVLANRPGLTSDALSDLQDLQSRVKAIELAMIEMEKLAVQENSEAQAKLDSMTKQIEDLKSHGISHRRDYPKRTSEISEADSGVLTKDIMLDEASECSPYEKSKRELSVGENQMLELWEMADQDRSTDLTVSKAKKGLKNKSNYDITEKELSMDKLEISKRFKESREEGSKQKVLERLNSDVQKLINLHITVQDLKKKVEITEENKREKSLIESQTLKEQLEETESTILKLFEFNEKLTKHVEDFKFAPPESEDTAVRRNKVFDQARKVSEKIGRLQLEVQKIQFVLLKLDSESESNGRSRNLDAKRRVLLKDYLYGAGRGGRTNNRRKRALFCACMEPSTKED